ncbi:MAG: peptide-methionine (S)-S-oxide reductase MsrA [Gemmatimonadaceae bacterium]
MAVPVALFAITSGGEATPLARAVTPAPSPATISAAASLDTAVFAGGCFWSMERPFDHVPGVSSTAVGYTGGHTPHPTYEQVGSRKTGHTEAVQVVYDPAKVTYDKLLDVYWHNIDPVTKDAQFCDGGNDYRTAIFYRSPGQQQAAERSSQVIQQHFKKQLATEIAPASTFWMAEEYHQHFADRNPVRYNMYKRGCGRDEDLRKIWGDRAAPFVPKH